MKPYRKGKIRWGALTGVLTTIGGAVVTVVTHPDVLNEALTKVGVTGVLAGAIISAITKAVVRKEYER
jgi:hypothetical protein